MRQPVSQPYDHKAARSRATSTFPNPKKINSSATKPNMAVFGVCYRRDLQVSLEKALSHDP
jgi:hypothetical protein